jgi:hypothetical protein
MNKSADKILKALDLNLALKVLNVSAESFMMTAERAVLSQPDVFSHLSKTDAQIELYNELIANAEISIDKGRELQGGDIVDLIEIRSDWSRPEAGSFEYTWAAVDFDGNRYDVDVCDWIYKVVNPDHFKNRHAQGLRTINHLQQKKAEKEARLAAAMAPMPANALGDIWPEIA